MGTNEYGEHLTALELPNAEEEPIVDLIRSISYYTNQLLEDDQATVVEREHLHDGIAALLRGLHILVGIYETGRLDPARLRRWADSMREEIKV